MLVAIGRLVFTDSQGGPIRCTNWRRRVWVPAASLVADPVPTFHDIRHTVASMLLAAGRPIHEVQQRLGHPMATVTLDVYGHYIPQSEGSASVLDDLFGSERAHNVHMAPGELVELEA